MNRSRTLAVAATISLSMFGAACAKKKVAATVPPPPAVTTPAPAPVQAARPAPAPPAKEVSQAPRYPDAATRARIDQLLSRIEDAYFDYDKAFLRTDAVSTLKADSTELRDILKDYPDYKLTIQGHCDERGSAEYNLALGDRRAQAAKEYLVEIGIPAGQLAVITYGKERPVCTEHDEACWQKNRRVHIVAMAQNAQP